MDSFSIQIMPNVAGVVTADQMIDAAGPVLDGDEKKLQRALVGGGTAKVTAALLLAFFRSPPGGMFFHSTLVLFYAYYGILLAVVVFGVAEVGVGYWISRDPTNRRGIGKVMVWPSVVALVVVAGLGGFTVFKI